MSQGWSLKLESAPIIPFLLTQIAFIIIHTCFTKKIQVLLLKRSRSLVGFLIQNVMRNRLKAVFGTENNVVMQTQMCGWHVCLVYFLVSVHRRRFPCTALSGLYTADFRRPFRAGGIVNINSYIYDFRPERPVGY